MAYRENQYKEPKPMRKPLLSPVQKVRLLLHAAVSVMTFVVVVGVPAAGMNVEPTVGGHWWLISFIAATNVTLWAFTELVSE